MISKKDIKNIQEFIKETQKDYDFTNEIEIEINKKDNKEAILEKIEETNEDYSITNKEIIYYNEAMDILTKNDLTLIESLEIADEYGYTPGKLNSCMLAGLLLSRRNQDDFEKLKNRVGEFVDDLLSKEK